MRQVRRVGAHDDPLGRLCDRRAGDEIRHRRTRLGFALLGDGILQVERQRVGVAGQRLGEQLRPRAGHEQLATHRVACRLPFSSCPRVCGKPPPESSRHGMFKR